MRAPSRAARALGLVLWAVSCATPPPPAAAPAPPDTPPPAPLPDADNDGVADAQDRCPRLPGGRTPGARYGCPPPGYYDAVLTPADRDEDGVDDMVDACPRSAGSPNADPERHGCPPPLDQDGDTVADVADRCPTVAGPVRAEPGFSGCPDAFIEVDRLRVVDRVTFATSSEQIDPASNQALDAVARVLLSEPQITVRIEGHTDDRGPAWLNTALSERRAQAVVRALVGRGVGGERLTHAGLGPTRPAESNETPEGRARNRRVEFWVVSGAQSAAVGAGDPASETGASASARVAVDTPSVPVRSSGLEPSTDGVRVEPDAAGAPQRIPEAGTRAPESPEPAPTRPPSPSGSSVAPVTAPSAAPR